MLQLGMVRRRGLLRPRVEALGGPSPLITTQVVRLERVNLCLEVNKRDL